MLEHWVRSRVQQAIQDALGEVAELMDRDKSQRCKPVDSASGNPNGHGRLRRLSLSHGTSTGRRMAPASVLRAGATPRA